MVNHLIFSRTSQANQMNQWTESSYKHLKHSPPPQHLTLDIYFVVHFYPLVLQTPYTDRIKSFQVLNRLLKVLLNPAYFR